MAIGIKHSNGSITVPPASKLPDWLKDHVQPLHGVDIVLCAVCVHRPDGTTWFLAADGNPVTKLARAKHYSSLSAAWGAAATLQCRLPEGRKASVIEI
jgi:hypothetical protein